MAQLAGAIILVPTDGGKQIAFAFFISTIWLRLTAHHIMQHSAAL